MTSIFIPPSPGGRVKILIVEPSTAEPQPFLQIFLSQYCLWVFAVFGSIWLSKISYSYFADQHYLGLHEPPIIWRYDYVCYFCLNCKQMLRLYLVTNSWYRRDRCHVICDTRPALYLLLWLLAWPSTSLSRLKVKTSPWLYTQWCVCCHVKD